MTTFSLGALLVVGGGVLVLILVFAAIAIFFNQDRGKPKR